MALIPIGDLAQSFASRNSTNRLKHDLGRLTKELSSGWSSDPSKKLGGNTATLSSVDRKLTVLSAYENAAHLLMRDASVAGASLERIRDALSDVVNLASDELQDTSATYRDDLSRSAMETFRHVVGTLNVTAGGRHIFSGTAAGPAVKPSDEIIADLKALIATEVDQSGAEGAIDAYFSDAGEYSASAYIGSTELRSPIAYSEIDSANIGLHADDKMIREALSGLAKIALLNDPQVVPSDDGTVFRGSIASLSGLHTEFLREEAVIGRLSMRVETSEARNAAERLSLQTWRTNTVGADPYETSLQLQEKELQLETLFTVTARLSRLSLLNALR